MGDLEILICDFQDEQMGKETFILLRVYGALLFGGEEQSEQVVK